MQNTAHPKNSGGNYASVNGLDMYYEIHGVGDPLILLHGSMSTIGDFAGILPELAKHRKIVAIEQQGHGHTADVDRPFSFEQMADDTAKLLNLIAIKKADFFGYSAGGTVVLEIAIRHPELVRKLALSSTVYSMDGYIAEIGKNLPHLTAAALPAEMRAAYEAVAPHPDNWPRLVDKVAKLATVFKGIQLNKIKAIKAQALVIVADGDIVRSDHAEELAHLLHAEFAVLPKSDHVSYLLKDPGPFISKLTAFLAAGSSALSRPTPKLA